MCILIWWYAHTSMENHTYRQTPYCNSVKEFSCVLVAMDTTYTFQRKSARLFHIQYWCSRYRFVHPSTGVDVLEKRDIHLDVIVNFNMSLQKDESIINLIMGTTVFIWGFCVVVVTAFPIDSDQCIAMRKFNDAWLWRGLSQMCKVGCQPLVISHKFEKHVQHTFLYSLTLSHTW